MYTLDTQDKFTINYHSGQVVATSRFIGEAGSIYRLEAKVEDKGGRQGSLASTAELIVSIILQNYSQIIDWFVSINKINI